jgi:hypothetical protein
MHACASAFQQVPAGGLSFCCPLEARCMAHKGSWLSSRTTSWTCRGPPSSAPARARHDGEKPASLWDTLLVLGLVLLAFYYTCVGV